MAGTATPQPSAPATPPAVLSPQEMNDGQLQEFMAKGTRFPKEDGADPPPADTPADSAPAEPVEQVASTDASTQTASETVTPEKKVKGKGLKARVDQLAEENEGLSQRLSAELRRRRELHEQIAAAAETEKPKPKADAKPGSSPAATDPPTDADVDRFANDPDFPDPDKYEDLKKWGAAVSRFVATKISKEQFEQMFTDRQHASDAEAAQTHELNQAITVAEERAKADEARDPEWKSKVDPGYARIPPLRLLPQGATPNPMHFIKDQIMFESEHPCSLSVYLSTDDGKQWASTLVRLAPGRIVREIAIKDASFASQDDDDPPPSLVSAAPPPAQTLGRKAAAPVDPLKAAMAAGDVEAFIDGRNKAQVGKR